MTLKPVTIARSPAPARGALPACAISIPANASPAALLLSRAGPAASAGRAAATLISYADLDLNRALGRAALRQRIRESARALCRADEVVLEFKGMRLTDRCIAEAIASAAA